MLKIIFALLMLSNFRGTSLEVEIENDNSPFYANNLSQRILNIREKGLNGETAYSNRKYYVQVMGNSIKVIGEISGRIKNGISLVLISTLKPGMSELIVRIENTIEKRFILKTKQDFRDLDNDGFPDVAELTDNNDKKAFIDWFIQIIELQYYFQNKRWANNNRDCSGLARFAFIEALKKHDDKWKNNWQNMFNWANADVEKYNYPDVPVINGNIFRIRGGSFTEKDLSMKVFSNFANSEKLLKYNSQFISKDLSFAKRGDLLFFKNGQTYHLMIFLGQSQVDKLINESKYVKVKSRNIRKLNNKDKMNYLVYHTGPIKNKEGEVRKVSVRELINHPDPKWRPIIVNPSFIGVYRWNILN
ncbi:MAG: DUF1175 domain-containing protein [Spirochaetota bacterium]|nr:DUF1175 domain-containing protein [Spirochaetota bacterium]